MEGSSADTSNRQEVTKENSDILLLPYTVSAVDLSMMAESPSEVLHVLVVDDSPVDRKLEEKLLQRSTTSVTAVDCVARALELLGLEKDQNTNTSKYDFIITDFSMPVMTGHDLLKRVKNSVLRDIPIIIQSSENIPERINMCMEDGAEEFLLKPLKQSDVARICTRVLQKKRE